MNRRTSAEVEIMGSGKWLTAGWRTAALAGLLVLPACGPGYGPAGVSVVVRRPPPERVEVVGTAPGQGYVWIRGHYAWQDNDYAWVAGRWDRPPQASYRHWTPGHWQHTRGGWYWVEGRWR
ncbi:MAG: YXWGXW repeat-containing protein [Gemmatimonadales bacterium]